MRRPFLLAAVALRLCQPVQAQEDCSRLVGRRQVECTDRAAARLTASQRAARRTLAVRKKGIVDEYGRKHARLTLGGILPAVEQQALPGDVLKDGPGVNNININYRNVDQRVWTSFAGKIYRTRYDPATRHYSGFESLDPTLMSARTKDPRKGKRIVIGQGISFDRPLRIRIAAETVLGNQFWTEFTASVVGNEEEGWSIPGVHYLDHYSRSAGESTPPGTAPPGYAGGKPPAPATPPVATSPARTPAPTRPATPVSTQEVVWRKPAVMPVERRPNYARSEIHVAGFAPELSARLAADPVVEKRGNVRIHRKNRGERNWAFIKKTTWKGPIERFDITIPANESDRFKFDRPMIIRVDVRTQGNQFYFTEVERHREDLAAPILLDRYTGN